MLLQIYFSNSTLLITEMFLVPTGFRKLGIDVFGLFLCLIHMYLCHHTYSYIEVLYIICG